VPKDKDGEKFDDLFEPFELEEYDDAAEGSSPSTAAPIRVSPESTQSATTIRCPSCGAENPEHNRHCEQCGARISQGPLPVAPPPMMRSTPGARALTVLAGVVLLVVLVAVVLNLLGDDDNPTVAPDQTTTTADTGTDDTGGGDDTVPPSQTVITPASVDASSELAGFEAANLIDGDTGTYWNDSSQRGVGAVLTFNFAQPVAITEMELVNIPDPVAFRRNYRMRDIQITVDDLAVEVPWSLPDNNEPARVPLNTLETRRVTVTVLSTYIGEPVEDTPSFTELALAEVRFFGSVTETSTP
jgi:hypothetical protein